MEKVLNNFSEILTIWLLIKVDHKPEWDTLRVLLQEIIWIMTLGAIWGLPQALRVLLRIFHRFTTKTFKIIIRELWGEAAHWVKSGRAKSRETARSTLNKVCYNHNSQNTKTTKTNRILKAQSNNHPITVIQCKNQVL